MTPKAQIKKEKQINYTLSKIKTICAAIDNLKKRKRKSIEIKKILANYYLIRYLYVNKYQNM